MSFEITTAFVQQYGSNVEMLAQQMGSRLRSTVMTETVVGESAYFDQIGEVAAQRVTNRHGDSPLNSTPHARRRVHMYDYETGDLIDDLDKIKTLIDPTNPYVRAHAAAMGRAFDDEIIDAYFGTAYTGKDGSVSVAFPASSQIAVDNHDYDDGTGDVGLTVGKLIAAKVKLWGQEALDAVGPNGQAGEQINVVCSAIQLGNLLTDNSITSNDFNAVKALVNGEVNTFMGMNFIRSERLPVNGSSHRRVMAYTRSGVKLGIGKDTKVRVSERGDKRYSTYAYFCQSIGATRMQEEKTLEIICDEP